MLEIWNWSSKCIIWQNRVWIVLALHVVCGFIQKIRELILMLTLQSLMILSLLSIKLNYLETLEPMLANGMWRLTTISVSLTCSDNFWQSLEVLLINCKLELKVKWTKYCVFSVVGNDKNDGNSDNIVLIIKDTKLSL